MTRYRVRTDAEGYTSVQCLTNGHWRSVALMPHSPGSSQQIFDQAVKDAERIARLLEAGNPSRIPVEINVLPTSGPPRVDIKWNGHFTLSDAEALRRVLRELTAP